MAPGGFSWLCKKFVFAKLNSDIVKSQFGAEPSFMEHA